MAITNNDILRRIRYTFDFKDNKMVAIFASVECDVTQKQVSAWLKKEDDPQYVYCEDIILASFLNGLINEKRGKREGPIPPPERRLNNNIILTKLKIALNLKAEDIIDTLRIAGLTVSKPELSALFRKAGNRQYRECQDQFLRNFLQGLQRQYREGATVETPFQWKDPSTDNSAD